MITADKKIYTVSQITREIKAYLEPQFATLWVEGEVSNFKCSPVGHAFFTLKDEAAQLQAILFKNQLDRLKFRIENGQKLVCHGRLSVYEKSGQYRLLVDTAEPKGLGALQLAFEQLKAKLEKEGLFDPEHKKPIPLLPERIGVVTSPTGAAIRDILNILGRRFSNVHVILNPVRVQGEGAAEEIARAIDEINEFGRCDVLIVGRGGGSLEDLWAFNEEIVARAIYRSRIPVISAVGHEIDWTIADFVADRRAPTPSAAAELVIASKENLVQTLGHLGERMKQAVVNLFQHLKRELTDLQESYAFRQPKDLIEQYAQQLDELVRQLGNYLKNVLQQKRMSVEGLAGKLHALSPLAILSRGYSLTFHKKTGRILKDAVILKKGETVTTRLHKGSFDAVVTEIER